MVPPHISTYQQYQYQNVQPTGTITAAPTVYKAPGATPVAQTGKTISSIIENSESFRQIMDDILKNLTAIMYTL